MFLYPHKAPHPTDAVENTDFFFCGNDRKIVIYYLTIL